VAFVFRAGSRADKTSLVLSIEQNVLYVKHASTFELSMLLLTTGHATWQSEGLPTSVPCVMLFTSLPEGR
jgi:hypothetical protein